MLGLVRFGGGQLASNKHLHFIHHSLTNGDCGWDQGLTGATSPTRPLKNLATGLYSRLLDTSLASEDSFRGLEPQRCRLVPFQGLGESPRLFKVPPPQAWMTSARD